MHYTTTSYIRLDTSNQLLNQYKSLASDVAQKAALDNSEFDRYDLFTSSYAGKILDDKYISFNLLLINLNAAILEGYLRAVISEIVHADRVKLNKHCVENRNSDLSHALDKSFNNIRSFIDEIENKGGYLNLKNQYKNYLDIDFTKVLDNELKADIEALFVLRNIAAHGTALVAPLDIMDESQKNDYPYKWQSQLKSVGVLAQREFGSTVHEALRHPCFASYFMKKTQELIRCIYTHDKVADYQKQMYEKLDNYKFGFLN
jgi:hypothetical protein